MKIAIIGSGALGCLYGAYLSRNHEVVMLCKKTEVDAINGFVVDRANVHNVPAPYNSFVVNLIHAIENTYKEQDRTMTKHEKGEMIVRQGDNRDRLYKVMQGAVSLYINYGTEREYLLGVYTTGKCFGVYNCYANQPSPYTAIADEDSVVMEIRKDELHQYLALNPKNAEEALISLSNQISLAMKHVEMISEELVGRQ